MCETEFKHQAVRWVSHTFAGAGPHQFVKNFQLPFTPQFLKIKTIGYYYEGTEPLTNLLQMARIGVIGTFHDKLVSHPNMSYKLGQIGWQDGQYQFQVLRDENNLEENIMRGRICICIEFLVATFVKSTISIFTWSSTAGLHMVFPRLGGRVCLNNSLASASSIETFKKVLI